MKRSFSHLWMEISCSQWTIFKHLLRRKCILKMSHNFKVRILSPAPHSCKTFLSFMHRKIKHTHFKHNNSELKALIYNQHRHKYLIFQCFSLFPVFAILLERISEFGEYTYIYPLLFPLTSKTLTSIQYPLLS